MLSKKFRLTKRGSFSYVYRNGQAKQSGPVRMLYVKSTSLKIGFSVGNKIGKATVRNKIKRQMRAAVRENIKGIRGGWQIVFLARPEITGLRYAEISQSIRELLKKAGMIL